MNLFLYNGSMNLILDEFIEAPSLPGFTPYSIYIIEVNHQEVGRIVWRLGNEGASINSSNIKFILPL